jgi:predicted tellurium resistance membrane protein TerC
MTLLELLLQIILVIVSLYIIYMSVKYLLKKIDKELKTEMRLQQQRHEWWRKPNIETTDEVCFDIKSTTELQEIEL